MTPRTNTVTTRDWLETTKGIRILAYVQNCAPTSTVFGGHLPDTNFVAALQQVGLPFSPQTRERRYFLREEVIESLERSLTEHADVWAELANL